VGLAIFAAATLASALLSLFLSRFGLDRLALVLGLLTLVALFVSRNTDALPAAASFAWWALVGLALGFTAVSLLRSARDLLG
jgi:hypothetical protein